MKQILKNPVTSGVLAALILSASVDANEQSAVSERARLTNVVKEIAYLHIFLPARFGDLFE